jgi:hypothetical protein
MGLVPEEMILFKAQREAMVRTRCYMIDFGLARRFLLSDGQVRKVKHDLESIHPPEAEHVN